jgi:hypothetical protein
MQFFLFAQNYSPFCVQAKIIKLVGLKNGGRLGNVHIIRTHLGGDQRFVTKPCTYRDLYGFALRRGGVKNLEKLRTYYVDVPLSPINLVTFAGTQNGE